eukprot:scaffold275894_cov33-Tisochrysis_lutea.AAC.1
MSVWNAFHDLHPIGGVLASPFHPGAKSVDLDNVMWSRASRASERIARCERAPPVRRPARSPSSSRLPCFVKCDERATRWTER